MRSAAWYTQASLSLSYRSVLSVPENRVQQDLSGRRTLAEKWAITSSGGTMRTSSRRIPFLRGGKAPKKWEEESFRIKILLVLS